MKLEGDSKDCRVGSGVNFIFRVIRFFGCNFKIFVFYKIEDKSDVWVVIGNSLGICVFVIAYVFILLCLILLYVSGK